MTNQFVLLFASASLLQAATTPPLSVTAAPASVTFGYQIAAVKLPAAQAVSMRASAGTPAFTTAVTGGSAPWLTVSPDNGKLPGSLSFQVNPTSLAVGTYTATVSVTVVGVTSPLPIPVTLNVTAPHSALTLSGTALTFSAPPIPPAPQAIQLSTTGSPNSFTAASGSPWLSVSPAVGVVLPGEQVALVITANPASLNPQAAPYVGKVTVTQAGTGTAARAQTITVTFTVNSSTPAIASVWPATLPINAGPQTLTIRGTSFYSATVVKIQGVSAALTPIVLSPTAMLAVVPAAQLTAPATLNVIVSNPAPGGDSAPASVTVGNVPGIQAIGNVASYATAAVSPGELVTIFGSNIGPAAPATMSVTNGLVDTTIGGVTVSVDNQAAPLLYVSQNQVTIQVPYEVTQGAGKQVTITNGTNPPATATVTIAATAPGLFTADGSGAGPAAALNFSATAGYTLNTASTPAKLGDTILLYLTGEGDYNLTTTPRTGLVVPASMNPLPQLNPLPTVTIGGAAATVSYAGPLVGSILGLVQINVVVPASAATGQAVPLVVTVGVSAAQTGVTLAVHP